LAILHQGCGVDAHTHASGTMLSYSSALWFGSWLLRSHWTNLGSARSAARWSIPSSGVVSHVMRRNASKFPKYKEASRRGRSAAGSKKSESFLNTCGYIARGPNEDPGIEYSNIWALSRSSRAFKMGRRVLSSRQPKAADTFVNGVEYAGSATQVFSGKEMQFGGCATYLHFLETGARG
jgi:hypothetical protein